LQKAYNYNTTGNANTAPATGTKWRTTLVVYGMQSVSSLPRKESLMSLARLLAPFWPSEAFACVPIQPPTLSVHGVANVDIIEVKTGTGVDGSSYTYPKTIRDTYTGNVNVTYADQKDFLNRYPNSTWNVNYVKIQTVTDESSVSPPGSQSGGPSNITVNPGATTKTGAFAGCAVLVK
jgi:hypothetical protein